MLNIDNLSISLISIMYQVVINNFFNNKEGSDLIDYL